MRSTTTDSDIFWLPNTVCGTFCPPVPDGARQQQRWHAANAAVADKEQFAHSGFRAWGTDQCLAASGENAEDAEEAEDAESVRSTCGS